MSDSFLLRASVALSAAALGLALFLFLSDRSGESSGVSAPPATIPSSERGDSSSPASAPPAIVERRAVPEQLDGSSFWQLIDETRAIAGADTSRQSELLKERLTRLSPQEIVQFAKLRRRLDEQAYTWKLWGAAATIEDGCSDDCFRDFRAYLISLGHGPYEQALRDPDSFASIAGDAESGDWESADDVARDAYSSVTGQDFPLGDEGLSGRPAGSRVDMSEAELRARYPRLAARFRD